MVMSDQEGPKKQEPLSRVEREVLEILEQSDSDKPPVTDMMRWKAAQQRRERATQVRNSWNGIQERLTPGMLLLFGVLLAVFSWLTRHSSAFVSRGFAIAALICLILPFVLNWRQRGSTIDTGPKRWRGKDIDLSDRSPNPIDDLKRWWRNRQ